MAKQINLGKVKGTDATINGVTTLTMTGENGITVTQNGTTLTLSAPTFATHAANTSNPHNVTKAQVGLGNVDNKSEATIIADAKTNIMTSANINDALGYTAANAATLTSGLAAKQDKITGTAGQVVSFDASGNPVAVDSLSQVYGFEIDTAESNPASKVRYLGINSQFQPFTMNLTTGVPNYGDWADAWFIKDLKPRMMNSDGTVAYDLDPDDYTKKADGTASDIADDTFDGDVMVGIPTVWLKFDTSVSGKIRVYIAPYQVDASYHAYSHTDANGEIIPYTYVAAYNGWVDDNSKLRSISGKTPTANQTGTTQITEARANNASGVNIWDISVLADRELLQMLLVLIGKSTNTQAVFGNGNMNGYVNAENTGVLDTGTMNTRGLFYGTSANNVGVKVFGIENFWGNLWDRTQGLVSVDGLLKAKLTRGTQDGTTVSDYNTTGNGYIEIGTPTGGSDNNGANNYFEGYISEMIANQYGLFMGNLSSGSASTHYADYGWNIKSDHGAKDGAFGCSLNDTVSRSYWTCGARLSLKPTA